MSLTRINSRYAVCVVPNGGPDMIKNQTLGNKKSERETLMLCVHLLVAFETRKLATSAVLDTRYFSPSMCCTHVRYHPH